MDRRPVLEHAEPPVIGFVDFVNPEETAQSLTLIFTARVDPDCGKCDRDCKGGFGRVAEYYDRNCHKRNYDDSQKQFVVVGRRALESRDQDQDGGGGRCRPEPAVQVRPAF